MGEYPIAIFFMPFIALGVVAYMAWSRRAQVAKAAEQYKQFQLSALAPRMGLTLVSGDPNANLMLAPHNAVGTRITDEKPYEWNVRMQGAPRGRAVDILYYHRRERVTEFTKVKFTYYDDAYIAVQLHRPVPDFEVVSNKSSLGPLTRRLPLPVQRSGDPLIDREFTIASQDPSLAAKLVPLLTRFDPNLHAYGVHLEATGGALRFRAGPKHTSGVFYFVEQIVPILEQIADRVEQG